VLLADGDARSQEASPLTGEFASFRIDWHATKIALSGDVSSAAHETILRQTAQRLFPQDEHVFDLHFRTPLPAGWALVSELTLRAISVTESAVAEISGDKLVIRGITSDITQWQRASDRLQKSLLPGMSYVDGVSEFAPTASLREQCNSLFYQALQGRRIEFSQGSDEISSSAYPLLDELIQISADCTTANLVITGHADSGGEEAYNLRLSEARASAVLAYMVSRGIPAARLAAIGAGSSRPLQDNDSGQALQRNRRIELQIVFP
jgi:OOP family OmpA-OmpF porin